MQAQTISIEMNTEYVSAVRFPAWMALGVFSAVCVAAISSRIDKDERGADEKWSLAVSIISMIVAMLAVAAYLFQRALFVGQMPEGILVIVVMAFWGFGLPTMMNPGHAIAVSDTVVVNANLYFFAWGSFGAAVFLVGSLVQDMLGVNIRATPTKNLRWFGLCATSLVVMGTSTRIFRNEENNCSDPNSPFHASEFCKRTSFGIALGTISFVASLVVSLALSRMLLTAVVELGITTILLILWCFGVGFITFGNDLAPGTLIGNLYFSTWLSFIFVMFLFSDNFRDFLGAAPSAHTDTPQSGHPANEGLDDLEGTPSSSPHMIGDDGI